jgi:hypothetical protein
MAVPSELSNVPTQLIPWRNSVKTSWLRTAFFLPLLAISSLAWGQDLPDRDNRFRVYLGGFWPQIDSKIAINGEDLEPLPPINVEDVLRVPDSKGAAWGGIDWRISKRNTLEFEYFALNRNGGISDTFSPPLEVGDSFIESGEINTFYDTSVMRLTYGYSLLSSERMDLQLKAGLHVAKLEAGLQILGQICTPNTAPAVPPGCPTAQTDTASQDVTAPLPHFGASFTYSFSETWGMRLTAIGFAIEIDSLEGSIVELDADVAWKPWKQLGIGAGWRYFNTNVKAGNSTLNGEFDFEYSGPTVFINYWF